VLSGARDDTSAHSVIPRREEGADAFGAPPVIPSREDGTESPGVDEWLQHM